MSNLRRILGEGFFGLVMIPLLPFIFTFRVLLYLFVALCQLGNIGLSSIGLVERRYYFERQY